MSNLTLEVGNTATARLYGLRLAGNEDPELGALCEVTLEDKHGDVVPGQTWPTTMLDIGGGTYEATLSPDIGVECGHKYRVIVTAVATGGERLRITDYVKVVARAA